LKEEMKVRGYFKIDSFDKNGNIIETYEDNNLVVVNARIYMAKLVAGQVLTNPGISRFIIGTDGYGANLMTPLNISDTFTKGQHTEKFDENRNQLISQSFNDYYYTVDFSVPSTNGYSTTVSGIGYGENTASSSPSVSINASGTVLTYVITLPMDVANGPSGSVAFTEAGLFFKTTGNTYNMFAMKTFPVKAKDFSVEHKITWSLYF
jgi:hypothetical protein